ncbi:MAG: class I SAM-dependent methyltransferase [Planctomycetes bacterium]|nr:class I SAM-dependent methyltransferase [Planctomycetota bacterium]
MHETRASRTPSSPRSSTRRPRLTARTADRHELYQIAVQDPETDLAFLEKAFRRWRKRAPYHFREDFCGTALLSATWAAKGELHTAEGFDLDGATLAWGRAHNLRPMLGDAASRVQLHQRDVRAKGRRPADLRVAQNFSYMVFKERAELLEYFRAAHRDLARDGVFALDHYGGLEATEELTETRRCPGFTYVWEQAKYLPGTGEYVCHIGFKFRDGSAIKRAFTYPWRYWHLTELQDLLHEAGFDDVHLYFEQGDEDDQGNGEFLLDPEGRTSRNCAGIVTYLIAVK